MTESKCPRSFVLIGTSGSPDYLNDTTGDRRYWTVPVPVVEASSIDNDVHAAIVKALIDAAPYEMNTRVESDDEVIEDEP
jgi:predicted P-loop ATPase